MYNFLHRIYITLLSLGRISTITTLRVRRKVFFLARMRVPTPDLLHL